MTELEDIKLSIEKMPVDEIAPIVRKAVGDGSAAVESGWTVEVFSAESAGMGTLGFLKVIGRANILADVVDWVAVVKVMGIAEKVNRSFGGGEGTFNSPEREVSAFESDFFEELDGGFKAAPCYGVTSSSGATLLWMEDLSDSLSHPWSRNEFLISARNIGFFNGSWPESKAPTGVWLDRDLVTNRPMWGVQRFYIDLFSDPENKLVLGKFGDGARVDRVPEMWDEFVEIAGSLAGLPRVVSHNDLHARNVCFRYEENGPVSYVVDWASVGLGPVGTDGGTLVGGSLLWEEEEVRLISQIEGQMFTEYIGGLEDAGYGYVQDEVRLGYLSNFVIYLTGYLFNVIVPDGPVSKIYSRRFGVEGDEFSAQLAFRLRTFKPLFDEAVVLARQLG